MPMLAIEMKTQGTGQGIQGRAVQANPNAPPQKSHPPIAAGYNRTSGAALPCPSETLRW